METDLIDSKSKPKVMTHIEANTLGVRPKHLTPDS